MNQVGLSSLQQRFQRVDRNGDGVLQRQEIVDELCRQGDLRPGADLDRLVDELRLAFEGQRHTGYTRYDAAVRELQELARKYPGLAETVSLGKSAEGREIWALRIGSKARGASPGVVITGCHHAREWMTVEVPLQLARDMLQGYAGDPAMKKRVDQGETWIVPVVNPDGYEFSHQEDSWWRKNRRPIEETGCPKPKPPSSDWGDPPWLQTPVGVDLNRNYFDAEFPELYRSAGDTPCSFRDDPSHTSDAPRSDTYRGPSGASEPEVQAMQRLVLGNENIRGVVDYHSYGNLILYPWGHTQQPPDNLEFYQNLGENMRQQLGSQYKVGPSHDLYPTHGTSSDLFHARGKIALTMELGTSFQPPSSEIAPTVAATTRANLVFIDTVLSQPH